MDCPIIFFTAIWAAPACWEELEHATLQQISLISSEIDLNLWKEFPQSAALDADCMQYSCLLLPLITGAIWL